MTRRPIASLGPALVFAGGLWFAGCKPATTTPVIPEVEVVVAEAAETPVFEDWVGTLNGLVNADIRAQVAGYLMAQAYQEGGVVRRGDLLFQVDSRPFQAALDVAKARLEQDKALAGKTALDVRRYTPLAREQAISQEELDNAIQANLAALAQVKSDEAAVEAAQLNLEFTRITSPVDGLAGIALAQIGNLVSPTTGTLTTVSAIDPIKVFFSVNERSYVSYWKDHIGPGQPEMNLEMILADGSVYPLKGRLAFADRQVSGDTGTLQLVGLFPNPKLLLRPGQYARVRAQTGIYHQAIVLPQRAVAELQGGYQVCVVDEQDKFHIRPVQVGQQTGTRWILVGGLKPGERVVVEGTQKAKEGDRVAPRLAGLPPRG